MVTHRNYWISRFFIFCIPFATINLWLNQCLAQTTASPSVTPSASAPSGRATANAGKVFGRWQIACKAGEACRAAQSIISGVDAKVPVLVARLYRDPTPTLILVTPLGSFLGPGMTLQVDKLKPSRLAFETCTEDGCILGVQIQSRLQGVLEKGKELSVTYFPTAQRPVTAKLSLENFADAWKALK
jgi:invasion protein IalB